MRAVGERPALSKKKFAHLLSLIRAFRVRSGADLSHSQLVRVVLALAQESPQDLGQDLLNVDACTRLSTIFSARKDRNYYHVWSWMDIRQRSPSRY